MLKRFCVGQYYLIVSVTLCNYWILDVLNTFLRSHSIKTDNSSYERAEQFKYLGGTLTYQNSIQEEIMSRFKLGNACYHSVQNRLSSGLLFKNLRLKDK